MYPEETLLKYLDNEMPVSELQQLEEQLTASPELRVRLEYVRENRKTALDTMNDLNPVTLPETPPLHFPTKKTKRFSRILRYAAAAVLVLGSVAILWLVNRTSNDRQEVTDASSTIVIESTIEDLDCYISPNRCWNDRKLPMITIKIQ